MAIMASSPPPSSSFHLSVFVSSPIKPVLTPESLQRALPPDESVGFWTAEKEFLSADAVKGVATQQDRQIMALISRRERPMDHMDSVKSLIQKMLENQDQMRRALDDAQQERADMRRALDDAQQERADMRRALDDLQQERDLYAPLNSTRRLAIISLMATLLKQLNHLFLKRIHQRAEEMDHWVGNNLPFKSRADIGYFKAWWFVYNEIIEVRGVPIEDFWRGELGYEGKKQSADSKKNRKLGTAKARKAAHTLECLMSEVDGDCIAAVGGSMTKRLLRSTIGFYISVMRSDKNVGVHLIENLLRVQRKKEEKPEQYHRPITNDPFQVVDKELAINDELRGVGCTVIEDILSHIDKLGDFSCIKCVVEWYGRWLLNLCQDGKDVEETELLEEEAMNEEAISWQWIPELQCDLYFDPNDQLYHDRWQRLWTFDCNKWLAWIVEKDAWCSWDGNEWNKEF